MQKLNIGQSSRFDVLRWLNTVILVSFPLFTLFVNHGDTYALEALTLIGIWAWLKNDPGKRFHPIIRAICLCFAGYFLIAVLSYLFGNQTDAGFRFLGRDLRFVVIAPVYLALRSHLPTAKSICAGFALSAFVSGVIAVLDALHANGPIRVEGQTDLAISFGDLMATMVLCIVASYSYLVDSKHRSIGAILLLSLAAGVVAMLLSGTRGAWASLFLLLPAMTTSPFIYLKRRHIVAIAVVLICTIICTYIIAQSDIRYRLTNVKTELENYYAALRNSGVGDDHTLDESRCLDSQAFLESWLAGSPSRVGQLAIEVVRDPLLFQEYRNTPACNTGYVMRLSNSDQATAAEIVFPRAAVRASALQQTELVVKGNGGITFPGGDNAYVGFNTENYTKSMLRSRHNQGNYVGVYVAPGSTVSLIPVNGYFGEYTFAVADNAIGTRLELWRTAWRLFLAHPILGVGIGAFQTEAQKQAQEHIVAPFSSDYDHPHNDYFNALASSGLIGFLSLLALIMVPGWAFIRAVANRDREIHGIGLCGAMTVGSFAIYGFSDSVFIHSIMITWYLVYVAIFLALIDARSERGGPKGVEQE